MRKVAPSVIVREELDRLLQRGAERGGNIISELVSTLTRQVVQELVEAEQTDFLGARGRYERREGSGGMRNGYEPGRIRTAEGLGDAALAAGAPLDAPAEWAGMLTLAARVTS